jgi:hypothetical protein
MADDRSDIVQPKFGYNTNVVTQLQIDHLEKSIRDLKIDHTRRMDTLESRLSLMVIITVTTLLTTVGGLFMRIV